MFSYLTLFALKFNQNITRSPLSKRIIFLLSFIVCLTSFHVNAATFTVNTTGDQADANPGDGICDDGSGNCSLQAAIIEANIFSGADRIEFNIPGAGVHTIQPIGLGLPIISSSITIDATTQTGYAFGSPKIVIDGTFVTAGGVGLEIQGSSCVIRGLVIGNFEESAGSGGVGIRIDGGINNIIAENFIGIAADGAASLTNFSNITLSGSATLNIIGGTGANDRNIISGADDTGIYVDDADENTIAGNYIGTDKNGTSAVPNFFAIVIASSQDNLIGGSSTNSRNIISGNTVGAIDFINATKNTVQNNFIGTNVSGTAALPNDYGIYFQAFNGNLNKIGGVGAGNLISGNRFMGIDLQGNNNDIEGNFIGVLLDSTTALPNGRVGIQIAGGEGNRIGGDMNGMGNLIAFHTGEGIRVSTGAGNGMGNHITRNMIFENEDIGIDVGYSVSATRGETINDIDDGDSGPNNFQNYADVKDVTVDVNTNSMELTFDISSDPSNSSYPLTVEFFLNDGNGQGKTYIGSDVFSSTDYANSPKTITINPPSGIVFNALEEVVNTVTDAAFNTSEFGLTTATLALPTALAGRIVPNGVQLDWTTLPNLDEIYTLEKADENGRFVSLNQQKAQSSSTPSITYSYVDISPKYGANRYRVESLDQDGEIAYSNIVEIWLNPLNAVNIYPNPVKLGTKLFLENLPNKPIQVELRDLHGRILKGWKTETGSTKSIPLDLQYVSSGVYMLHLKLEQDFGHKIKLVIE